MVTISNGQSMKSVPEGFSWTTFFFGFFPALFRGDIKWAAVIFLTALVTFGLGIIVMAFIYNARYLEDMQGKGWRIVRADGTLAGAP